MSNYSNADFIVRMEHNRDRVGSNVVVRKGGKKSYDEALQECLQSFSFRRANQGGRTFMLEKLKDEYLTIRLSDFM